MSSSENDVLLETFRLKKRRKCDEEWVPEPAEEDRISNLSDELIHRIMSFMDTKCAVQTCVLSRRWESVWKSLPYLDFNDETFPFKEVPGEDRNNKLISFNNFITQMLFRRHHTNLVKVRLNSRFRSADLYAFMVEGLIAYAVDHNVQQLSILWYGDIILPESFYNCPSLVAFYVHDTQLLPKFLALPALKSLTLKHVDMSQDFLHPRNFSGCPNLETLKLSEIMLRGEDTTLFINAPNLKRLNLSFVRGRTENRCKRCKVVIDAPELTTFQCCGYAPIVYSSHDLTSIDDVCLNIYHKCFIRDVEGEDFVDMYVSPEHVLRSINSLKEFRHAKSLTLSLETFEALATFPTLLDENRLSFAKLKYLKVKREGWRSFNDFAIPAYVLNFFLNNSTKFKFC